MARLGRGASDLHRHVCPSTWKSGFTYLSEDFWLHVRNERLTLPCDGSYVWRNVVAPCPILFRNSCLALATRENVRLPQFGRSVDQLPLSPASEVVTMCSVGWRAVKWMHA